MEATALSQALCPRFHDLSSSSKIAGPSRVQLRRRFLPALFSSPAVNISTRLDCTPRAAQDTNSRGASSVASASPNGRAPSPANLAVFVSGGGSNFKSIHSAILEGRINGHVVAVVSDKPDCGGCEYARAHGIPILAYPRSKKFAPEGHTPEDLVSNLKSLGVEYVLLAGYLKLIPVELCRAFPRAILNIHPALLPAFGGKGYYGMRVHEAVVKTGARFSGPTIHFVDEEFDNGPIVAQSVVEVYHDDTPEAVQQRVLKEEHKLYPAVVEALCGGRIAWREDGVPYVSEPAKSTAAVL